MRSRRISRVLAAWAVASAAACAPSAAPPGAAPAPATNAPPAASAAGAPPITLAALRASLAPLKPSTVVFDIDDTTLYTGLAFLFAQGYFKEKDGGRFRDDRAFWTLINDSLDARFSKPKRIARELIAFHQARGDTIVPSARCIRRCPMATPTATSRTPARRIPPSGRSASSGAP